ncbi:Crp/Fnr family transcriptional regulator [Noviherbaspirillum denitrificans]|uniref:Transcriptional regulator n=1 Tax=Noviherbaspirillum denitrificans TaxID=1968433 RepID=A0A254TE50_9BURK|nr:helix-turn-helix domain-containing protein [Noviherbaspirillum denitrificans]OWW20931.1 transcriptional regulator [Noviherbaspirillum denitrificans]
MLTTQLSDARPAPLSLATPSPSGAAWQRQAKLWSSLKEVCDLLRIPAKLGTDDFQFQHMQFKAGQRIHTIGQPFDMLYVVNSGFLKTVMIDELGNEQVLGFPMKGDMFGIDGIHRKQYATETVALSNCDVILIPFKVFAGLGRSHPELEASIYAVMSRELVREQAMVGTLGSLSAEARVARFLVFLSERFSEMGYSGTQFNLRMTRQEIGNYLGLTLETVSRTFSAFNTIGLISVDQRAIVVHDLQSLRTLRRLPPSRVRAKAEAKAKPAAAAA